MTDRSSDELQLIDIFYPYASRRRKEVREQGTRFVHYTNAEAAIAILQNKEIWMRLSSCMNDFSEVEHGLRCLYSAYHRPECGGVFKRAIDEISPGLSGRNWAAFRWLDAELSRSNLSYVHL